MIRQSVIVRTRNFIYSAVTKRQAESGFYEREIR